MLGEEHIQREFDKLFSAEGLDTITSFYGPIREDAIIAAEAWIECVFPLSYRLFLRRFGAAMFWSYEIHGLFYEDGDDEFAYCNIVNRTHNLRETLNCKNVNVKDIISVANDQDGRRFYFDLNCLQNGEAAVVAVSGYFGPTVVAINFIEFLKLVVQSNKIDNPMGF